MNDSPIGIFDSGLGGVYILKKLVKKLPCENIIYVADHKHIPYGKRTKKRNSGQIFSYLKLVIEKKM
jgi:glutamate racemase